MKVGGKVTTLNIENEFQEMQHDLINHANRMKSDNFSQIPAELQAITRWIVWKFETKNGKPTKVPYQPNGKHAKTNEPTTWGYFNEAVEAARSGQYDGIGFVFAQNDEYIGVDIDKCYENGEFNETARTIIDNLDSYTEFSPSGTGVHIIVKGALPEHITQTGFKNASYGVELYSFGRYFTFTGDRDNDNEIQERSDEIAELIEKYFGKEQLAQYTEAEFNSEPFNMEDDAETWKKMFTDKKNGTSILAMYNGELIRDNDHSATDYYLSQELAYYCDKDFVKMDRMFRNSGLYREKWDEQRGATTYGERTLITAAASKKKTISAYKKEYSAADDFPIEKVNGEVPFPKGYHYEHGCLYQEKKRKIGNSGMVEISNVMICRQIPYITRSFTNVENPQLYYELSWSDKGRSYKEVIPAGDLSIKKELLKLSYKSLAVTDNNAKDLITYFDRLNMIRRSDHELLVERIGHIKNTFIHPLTAKGVTILPPDIGEKQLLEAFQTSGTASEWIEYVLKPIQKHPRALLMVVASFTSVLLQDLKMKPFIVDLSGVTSQGKTTVLRACASVWGTEHLVSEWNLTKVAAERKASFLNSFPLLLDDTRKADERQLQGFVYNFSGGRSKGRGSISGSQREYSWGNLMLSTGEDSLNSYAERAGGVAARILPITGLPFEGENYQFFNDLYEAIEKYFGSIGLEFLKKWQEQKQNAIPYFDSSYNERFQQKAYGNEVISRIARYYAAIVFTADLLNNFFNCNIDLTVLADLFDELNAENKAVDKPMQLLEAILSDLDSDRGAVYGEYLPHGEIKAIYKNSTIHLLPSYLKDFLKTEQNTIRNEWLRRGVSIRRINDDKEVDYQQIKHKGKKFRGVAIQPKIVEELGFDFQEKD
jgi:putative DNA primase/helicase